MEAAIRRARAFQREQTHRPTETEAETGKFLFGPQPCLDPHFFGDCFLLQTVAPLLVVFAKLPLVSSLCEAPDV